MKIIVTGEYIFSPDFILQILIEHKVCVMLYGNWAKGSLITVVVLSNHIISLVILITNKWQKIPQLNDA